MTRAELKEAISQKGVKFRSGLTKDELQDIYNQLYPETETEKQVSNDELTAVTENADQTISSEAGEEKKEDAFDELLGKIETAEAPAGETKKVKPLIESTRSKTKRGKSSPDSTRIEGYVLLLIVDTVFPASFAMLNNMLDKRIKVRAEELALKEKDFKALEPLADQAADYMAINLNPVAGFFLIATFMYGSNLINVRMNLSVRTQPTVIPFSDKKGNDK
ncbi:MAG: hypothetical protein GYA62_05200 [Bacteroidales bacterium]|nr:hypothetical protein [Bacteroidales bacterium]